MGDGAFAWVSSLPCPAWVEDGQSRLRVVNAAAATWLGQPPEALVGTELRGRVRQGVTRVALPQPDAWLCTAPDPTLVHLQAELELARSEVARLQAELRASVTTDAATGLCNARETRRRLRLEIDRCRRHGRSFSVVACRLEDAATQRRRLGPEAAEQLLGRVARACAAGRRSVDTVGHANSGNLLLILPETSAESGAIVAERIRRAVEGDTAPVDRADGTRVAVEVRLDARVVSFPGDGADLEALLNAAERR